MLTIPRLNCSGGPGAPSAVIAILGFGPSKWVVNRARDYGGAFIAIDCSLTTPSHPCQINNLEKVKVLHDSRQACVLQPVTEASRLAFTGAGEAFCTPHHRTKDIMWVSLSLKMFILGRCSPETKRFLSFGKGDPISR